MPDRFLGDFMADPSVPEPPLWEQLVRETPTAVRWLIGALTLGLASLAAYIWKRRDKAIEDLRVRMSAMEQRDAGLLRRGEIQHMLVEMEGRLDRRLERMETRFFKHVDDDMRRRG